MNSKPLLPAEQRFIDIHLTRERVAKDSDDRLPPPPYQVGGVEMLFTGVRLPPGVARSLLPSELEPAGNDSGLICVYTAATGIGVSPFSASFVAVEVKGFDAPDGSSGYCIVHGWYSDRGYRFMSQHYNQFAQPGQGQFSHVGDEIIARAGPPGINAVTVRARRAPKGPPEAQAIHHYLGKHPAGGASLFAIAFSGMADSSDLISLDIADGCDERMQLARPTEVTYCLYCYDANLTFGMPQRVGHGIDLLGAGAQVGVLDAFTRIGRAAILVAADGEIGAMTPRARSLVGDGLVVTRGFLRAGTAADQGALDSLLSRIATSNPQTPAIARIAIKRVGGQPLIVDALALGTVATGRPAALLLLTDTEQPISGSAVPALQLLGLTQAEAKIAALVGAGRSPREAADDLALSLNTVRSALKITFDKLGISRQAELATIVARLAG